MKKPKTAVILVAGEGKRLRPFTDTNPKCFAPVGGVTILENALEAFARHDCETARIVVGHHADRVRETIGERHGPMAIQYVSNPIYATTNSMYSLSLGLAGLAEPTWILEGDVFFSHAILDLPVSGEIAWFVDSKIRHLDGAYLSVDGGRRARALNIVRDLNLLEPNQCKSIGIVRLEASGVARAQNWLADGIAAGRQNEYYDLIFRDRMADAEFEGVDVAGHKWFEIDSWEDLRQAEELFSRP